MRLEVGSEGEETHGATRLITEIILQWSRLRDMVASVYGNQSPRCRSARRETLPPQSEFHGIRLSLADTLRRFRAFKRR